MKKAKIMLAILAVVAAVGGGLAFKAKTYNMGNYCVGTTAIGNTICKTFFTQAKLLGSTPLYYVTTANSTQCAAGITRCSVVKATLVSE